MEGVLKLHTTKLRDVSEWFVINNPDVALPSRKGNIKLQKLLYYAKAMYYAVYGEKLFEERIEAWENGPVVKEAYMQYRYGDLTSKPSEQMLSNAEITPAIERVLKVVNHIYGHQTTDSLIDLTHAEQPWKEQERLVAIRANPIIEEDTIKEYYKDLKDIFEMTEDEELENTEFIKINGNVFSYDKRYFEITDEIRIKLTKIGDIEKNQTYAMYLDDDKELIIY